MMTDTEEIKQSVEAFNSLSDQDTAKLKELNTKIQNHNGEWCVRKGGEKTADGAILMPWVHNDSLISEFVDFMYDRNLLPMFKWMEWSEGSKLFTSNDQTKYDDIDLATALKLIYTATRKERFHDGTLARAFESGGFPELVNRLVELRAQLDE